ncbi:MAG: TonB-dependent receptor [Myxococcales bacterium]|nr:TonB-dependent receptor [Myxococcales bacterium]
MRVPSTILLAGLLWSGGALAQSGQQGTSEIEQAPGQLTKAPEIKKFVEAEYPAAALTEGRGATVVLDLVLDDAGAVIEAQVVQSGGAEFDEAAIGAVYQFEFSPAEIDNKPASVRIQYEYVFTPRKVVEAKPPPADSPVGAVTGLLLERGTRKPLVGLRVVLEKLERETYSDAAGRFRFDDVPAGTVDLLVEDAAYEAVVDRETVKAGEETEVSYYVERTSFTGGSVTVVGRRPKKEVVRRTISIDEIRTVPGTSGDALKVVQNLPGAARIPFGGGALVLRGGGLSQAYVDTMPIPQAFHFGGLRSTIASALIESLDVVPGNFDVEFGKINGGVVDVRLRAPRSDGIHGYIETDVFDTGVLLEGPLGDHGSIAVAARRSYIDALLPFFLPEDGGTQFSTAPRYYDAQVLYEYKKGKNRVRALAYGSNDKIVATIEEPPENNPLIRGGAAAEFSFIGNQINWVHEFSEDAKNDASLAFYVQPFGFSVGPTIDLKLDIYVFTLREKFEQKFGENLTLTVGTDTDLTWGRVDGSGIGGPPVEGENRQGNINNRESEGIEGLGFLFPTVGVWSRAEWKLGDLTLLPGVRLDYFGAVDEYEPQPRLTARYQLIPSTAVTAGVGMFAQQVVGNQIAEDFGNPDLNIETATHYSVGGEHKFTDYLTLDLTLFYKDFQDLVRPVANPDIVYDNQGIGRAYGMELLLRHDLTERLYGWISYTLMRSERKDDASEPWRVFDFDQTHNLVVITQYKLTPKWQVGARFRYTTGNPTTPVTGGIFNASSGTYDQVFGANNSVRLDAFHQLDLRVDKLWVFDTWQMVTFLEVQNVYNRANPEGVSYNYDFTRSRAQAGLPIIPSFGVRGQF